jgi:R3H domain
MQAERSEKRAARRAAKEEGVQATQRQELPPAHLRLPEQLTARQRALIHEAADQAGVQHESRGGGEARALHVGDLSLPQVRFSIDPSTSKLARTVITRVGTDSTTNDDITARAAETRVAPG